MFVLFSTQECLCETWNYACSCKLCLARIGMLPRHYNFQKVLIKISCMRELFMMYHGPKKCKRISNTKKQQHRDLVAIRAIWIWFVNYLHLMYTDLWLVHIIYWIQLSHFVLDRHTELHESNQSARSHTYTHTFCPNNKTAYRTCKLNILIENARRIQCNRLQMTRFMLVTLAYVPSIICSFFLFIACFVFPFRCWRCIIPLI